MIKSTILFYLICLLLALSALQSCIKKTENVTDELLAEYKNQDGFLIVNLPPKFITAIMGTSINNNSEIKEILEGFEKIRVLICNDKSNNYSMQKSLYYKFNRYYEKNEFTNLAILNHNNDEITIKYYPKNNENSEIIVLLIADKKFHFLSAVGPLDEKKINIILKSDNIKIFKEMSYKNIFR